MALEVETVQNPEIHEHAETNRKYSEESAKEIGAAACRALWDALIIL